MKGIASWWLSADTVVAACLVPAAIAILISGLDDLALDAVCLWAWLKGRFAGRPSAFKNAGEQREKMIAIFVPLWHEHAVIAGMVEHNVAAVNYDNYHFFIGAYPNDEPTLDAVRDLEMRFPHVHLAVCPHDGPTSKADCLNWIYQRMLLFEEHREARFEIVMTHDAEDLIHPEALARINAYTNQYDMVQIPVLALPTPFPSIVHSIYCDEFAEWQLKDMPARQLMGSFVPSNGVGTGFTREALEKLARAEHNLIFEPSSLTEDYENGIRLHNLGCKQVFVPISGAGANIVATREFFRKPPDRPFASAPGGSPASRCNAGSAMAGEETCRRSIGSGATAKVCSAIPSVCLAICCSPMACFPGWARAGPESGGGWRDMRSTLGCWPPRSRSR